MTLNSSCIYFRVKINSYANGHPHLDIGKTSLVEHMLVNLSIFLHMFESLYCLVHLYYLNSLADDAKCLQVFHKKTLHVFKIPPTSWGVVILILSLLRVIIPVSVVG